ncbi:hypothetical protein GGD38_007637 [Chitinophagaceae bacterium OAS944]|nr:hypothetical protein [Chitinophagaceae bacterium OAS944]
MWRQKPAARKETALYCKSMYDHPNRDDLFQQTFVSVSTINYQYKFSQ